MSSIFNRQPLLLLLGFAVLGTGCEQAPTMIDTEIAFQLPMNDLTAQEELVRLTVEAWPASKGVCAQFADWRQVVCNSDENAKCPKDIDLNRRVDGPPRYRAEFIKTNGSWSFAPIDLGTQQNIQVSIRGYDETGQGIVYGCQSLELGQKTIINLSRPWCNQAVCLETFHAACGAKIECGLQGTNTSSGAPGPVCKTSTNAALAWEQDGLPCATLPNVYQLRPGDGTARCRQALILCEPGQTEPVEDGVCPAPEEACVEGAQYPADDLNCDGVAPVSQCDCVSPGEISTTVCNEYMGCTTFAVCQDDFRYGECETVTTSVTEKCDGIDSNCNKQLDPEDPEAQADCAGLGPNGVPLASRCGTGPTIERLSDTNNSKEASVFCLCGNSPACTRPNSGCCNDTCVEITTDRANCGSCGAKCRTLQSCCDGNCLDVNKDPANCGACNNKCSGDADSCCNGACVDTSTHSQNCGRCGLSCSDNEACCNSSCLNILSDTANCGACGIRCGRTLPYCIEGSCQCIDDSTCSGRTCCGGGCVDTDIDVNHCGRCSNACRSGQTCLNGRCLRTVQFPDAGIKTRVDAGRLGSLMRFDGGQ